MDVGDAGTRQSFSSTVPTIPTRLQHQPTSPQHLPTAAATTTTTTTPLPPPFQQQHREPVDRRYLDQPAMAAATVLAAPSAHYQSQPSYPSGYPHQPSGPSVANMISPEPRRSSDDSESSTRQSLPSISEVISGARPGQYPPPSSHPLQPGASLPSPFSSSSRQYPEADKHPSPQSLHSATLPPRQDALPAFSDSPRLPFSGRPGLPPVSDRRPTPPTKHDVHPPPHHHMPEPPKSTDPRALNGAYSQPSPAPTSVPYQPGQLPPGQQPLPPYQVSPRHAASHVPGSYDARVAPSHPEDPDYAARARYEAGAPRPFESWSYQEALSRIGTCSRTVFNFAEAYGRIAQEQHGSQPIPERLPTEREVGDMLSNVEYLKRSLEQVREVVLASIQSERAREGAKIKGPYDDDQDVQMYGDSIKPQYGITEVKKRRGRAAPPGRCHSCNRIDTPEWRRGPDGARTLCNACGLHYAKLERKRQLEARSLRPKPEERS